MWFSPPGPRYAGVVLPARASAVGTSHSPVGKYTGGRPSAGSRPPLLRTMGSAGVGPRRPSQPSIRIASRHPACSRQISIRLRQQLRVFRSQTSLCRLASTLASESALCEPLHGRVCTRSSIYSIVILSVRVRPCGRHDYSTQCRHFATSHELWESGAYFHKVYRQPGIGHCVFGRGLNEHSSRVY